MISTFSIDGQCSACFSYASVRVYSHRGKVNAKVKKIKEPAKGIKGKKFKHQRNFSLSFPLGVNGPLGLFTLSESKREIKSTTRFVEGRLSAFAWG